MWLLTLRDLQYRRVRLIVVVLLASVVMALLFVMTGLVNQFNLEPYDATESIGAEHWVLADGVSGPFTSAGTLPLAVGATLDDAAPVVVARGTMSGDGSDDTTEVVVVGGEQAQLSTTMSAGSIVEGRAVAGPSEVVLDRTAGFDVGDGVQLGPLDVEVVGLTSDTTVLAGLPLVFVELGTAQDLSFQSRDVVSGFLLDAAPSTAPDGTVVRSADDVAADALGPLEDAISSVDLVRALLWLVTAVIIGAVVFLSALERQRDFAILRAMGTPRRCPARRRRRAGGDDRRAGGARRPRPAPADPAAVPAAGARAVEGAVADPARRRGRCARRRGVRTPQGRQRRPGRSVRRAGDLSR